MYKHVNIHPAGYVVMNSVMTAKVDRQDKLEGPVCNLLMRGPYRGKFQAWLFRTVSKTELTARHYCQKPLDLSLFTKHSS